MEPGQYVGQGCVFPAATDTLAGQLDRAGYNWRGYMEDMATPCRHPKVDTKDRDMKAEADDQYATKHNPFVYFPSIIDRPKYCKAHVVDLAKLDARPRHGVHEDPHPDLHHPRPVLRRSRHTLHRRPPGRAVGSVNAWMREWIPQILASPAYKKDGLLIITAHESDGVESDSSACCGEVSGPNVGPGGHRRPRVAGRIGALVLSPLGHAGEREHHAVQPLRVAGGRSRTSSDSSYLGFAGSERARPLGTGRLQRLHPVMENRSSGENDLRGLALDLGWELPA